MRKTFPFKYLFLLGLMFCVTAPAMPSFAQDGGKKFIPLGRIPSLLQPGGAAQPNFKRSGTAVKFFVDVNSLEQNLSKRLSNACAHGRFNAQIVGRHYVQIETQSGVQKRLTFANSKGFNLRDPDNLGGRDLAYLFELDRTSQCRVYALPTVF